MIRLSTIITKMFLDQINYPAFKVQQQWLNQWHEFGARLSINLTNGSQGECSGNMLQFFLVMLVVQKLHTSPTGQRTKNGNVFSLRFAYKGVKSIPVHMDLQKPLKTLNHTSQVMSLCTEMLSAYAHSYRLKKYYTYTRRDMFHKFAFLQFTQSK